MQTTVRTLILASSSPRRRDLLQSLGLPFEVVASHADETVEPGTPPGEWVEQLAVRKAHAVAQQWPAQPALVIAADTIVVLDGTVLGKPASPAAAVGMLQQLQGRVHEVYSGVCVWRHPEGQYRCGHRCTRVYMRPLSQEKIQRYVHTGEPMDKAGSYAIQGWGATLVEKIEGDYFTVVGLPLNLLSDLLAEAGVALF
ncbi:MAG: Maf family protein [Alicyclobacillus sp.]|nr:Maf family protein [Alicyclobacillus sp.]